MPRIRRLLVANRGEIAVRIIRACRELHIESVALHADSDAGALHTRLADRVIGVGGASAADSYLAIARVIDAARRAGVDAVHPGYGFLSENASFAEACVSAGLIFVGPPADAMRKMGSKTAARALMQAAGVPVVPGETPGDQSEASLREAATRLGFPVIVKASAGGGGRGMRAVMGSDELDEAIAAARREATAAFGDGALYLERLVERPRHVEVQIMADAHGEVVHLFERECSIQRRHQKVVEESPSIALTPRVREAMCAAAIAAARAASYRNAGTIEFLLEGAGDDARFYFLEMNTRLQVEHPVTECVTGVDLVRAQIAVAQGDPLPWRQSALAQRGHAIECRVCAEAPADGFLPQAGALLLYREPTGPGVRVDSGVQEGDAVSVHFDSLLAKLVASAESREAAIARAVAALRQFPILGVQTNVAFLIRLLEHPRFQSGDLDTGFITAESATLLDEGPAAPEALAVAAVHTDNGRRTQADASRAATNPWDTTGGWRG